MTTEQAAASILFITSATNVIDVYSATNSSPWTAYKFAGDEKSVEALWRYVRHAIGLTLIVNGYAAIVARSPVPIYGALIATAYMSWLYYDAVEKGKAEGNVGWESA